MDVRSATSQIRQLVATSRFLWTHPLASRRRVAAFSRWLKWQLGSRMLPGGAVIPFASGTELLVRPGQHGATGNVYVGLHEFAEMAFAAHFLREGDRFFDIGSNVGSFSILAAGVAGATTIACEPVPRTHRALVANVRLNDLGARIDARNVGVGAEPGELYFTSCEGPMDHVTDSTDDTAILVPVTTVDALASVGGAPQLMKIDVEGFEGAVLEGASRTLGSIGALIVETNGQGRRYGYDEDGLHAKLLAGGFQPVDYDPFERRITSSDRRHLGNNIYVRDFELAGRLLRDSKAIHVVGQEV